MAEAMGKETGNVKTDRLMASYNQQYYFLLKRKCSQLWKVQSFELTKAVGHLNLYDPFKSDLNREHTYFPLSPPS